MIYTLILTHSKTRPGFTYLPYNFLKNTMGKGEIARYEQFLLFPQCFLSFWENFPPLSSNFKYVVCKLFQCRRVYNLSFGKGLTLYQTTQFWTCLNTRHMEKTNQIWLKQKINADLFEK